LAGPGASRALVRRIDMSEIAGETEVPRHPECVRLDASPPLGASALYRPHGDRQATAT